MVILLSVEMRKQAFLYADILARSQFEGSLCVIYRLFWFCYYNFNCFSVSKSKVQKFVFLLKQKEISVNVYNFEIALFLRESFKENSPCNKETKYSLKSSENSCRK